MSGYNVDTSRLEEYKMKAAAIRQLCLRSIQRVQGFKNETSDIDVAQTGLLGVIGMLNTVDAQLIGLENGIQMLKERYESGEWDGEEEFWKDAPVENVYGYPDDLFAPESVRSNSEYRDYSVYSYFEAGFSFNDYPVSSYVDTFLDSVGAGYLQYANITNWGLYVSVGSGNVDMISSEYARAALKNLLDGLPDSDPRLAAADEEYFDRSGAINGVFKALKNFSGDINDLLEVIESFNGAAVQDFFDGNDSQLTLIQTAFEALSATERTGLITILKGIKNVSKIGSESIFWCDNIAYLCERALYSYEKQIASLDVIENSLDAMGYQAVELRNAVGQVRAQYESIFCDMLMRNKDKIEGFIAGKLTKDVLSTITVPGLKEASSILGVTSDIVSVMEKGNIAAADNLYGLRMAENALSGRLDALSQIYHSGCISPEEMREAEQVYGMLRQTKISEYESLITLKKNGFNVGDVSLDTLRNKLSELKGFKEPFDFSNDLDVSSSVGGGGGGGQRF